MQKLRGLLSKPYMEIKLAPFLMSVILLIFMASLSACGNESQEDVNSYLTQCILNPGLNSQSKKFETIFTGNKASCHALLWRIPKKYLPNTGSRTTQNDAISRRVYVDNPPKSILPAWESRDQQTTKIQIKPYWEKPNETLMGLFMTIDKGVSLEKVEDNFGGWQIYDCKSSKCDVQRVVFYKTTPMEYIVSCSLGNKSKNYTNIPKGTVCYVNTYVDGRVYAKYPVLYETFAEWDEINGNVIRFLESLMLN